MTQGTVYLAYPHGDSIACPDAIGRNLAMRLAHHYPVVTLPWDALASIRPDKSDVLIGHPHAFPWTSFRRSLNNPGWRKVIMLAPYAHGDPAQVAWIDHLVYRCDTFVAITGDFWWKTISDSPFFHWRPKMMPVDLAVDRDDFPAIKHRYNAPGRRRFLYIGSDHSYKNLGYLSALAKSLPQFEFAWIGHGDRPMPGVRSLGVHDFAQASSKRLVAEFDFLISVSRSDANPATILEAMSWGLIPVCTPQSGYSETSGIVGIPLSGLDRARARLLALQYEDEGRLMGMQRHNWEALERHFNWDRFTSDVVDAIERPAGDIGSRSLRRTLRLAMMSASSPYLWLRPRQIAASGRLLAHRMLRSSQVTRAASDSVMGVRC